jgi:uncharacterized integral membrane protein
MIASYFHRTPIRPNRLHTSANRERRSDVSRGQGQNAVAAPEVACTYRDREVPVADGTSNGQADKKGVSAGAIIGGIAAVIALIFILQNTGSGEVQFLAWSFTFPIWLWALILFLLGVVSGYFFHWQRVRARRKG